MKFDRSGHARPFPRLVCEFQHPPARIEVHGFDGYTPPEACYLFDADDEGNVFLRASQSQKRLSPKEAAQEILKPFLER